MTRQIVGYVLYGVLSAAMFPAFYALEEFGTLRRGESLNGWLMLGALPAAVLLLPFQWWPGLRRHAAAYAFALFAVGNFVLGGAAARGSAEAADARRKELLFAPLKAGMNSSRPVRPIDAPEPPIPDDIDRPLRVTLPQGLDEQTAAALADAIAGRRSLERKIVGNREYGFGRAALEAEIQRDVTEKGDRYVRTLGDRRVGLYLIVAGVAAVLLAALAFFLTPRLPPDRLPDPLTA